MATNTFLFTDIEGSSRLWEEHGERLSPVIEAHDRLIGSCVDDQGGRVFKHLGDGIAAVFDSPAAALRCAEAIQLGLARIGPPDGDPIRVRMGIHSGEPIVRGADYFGPTVNRTARVMDAGHGGQVLVSSATRELVKDGDHELVDLGEHRLRDLGDPERLFQLAVSGPRDRFPALRTPDVRPNNLPTQLTSFVGRETELARVLALVEEHRLITITGVGGVGKTRVALHVAADVAHRFKGGTWLVRLAPLVEPDQVDSAFIEALGLQESGDMTPRDALRDHVAAREMLIVVDNCEHLIDRAADVVGDLLEAGPGVKVLATSRELLGVPGEFAFGLPSMGLDPSDAGGDADAVVLFQERALAANPRFEIADHEEAVLEVCRRLDGVPLAIELAAARVRTFSPGKLVGMLDEGFRLLTGGRRTTLPRQQTLEATIAWSHRLLSDLERTVFARLAAFRGSFTLEAARAICSDDDVSDWDVVEAVSALVDKSLVAADAEEDRFSLLETIRQFAAERLAESGSADEFRRRHAAHFRHRLEEAVHQMQHGPDWRAASSIRPELDNVRQALAWSISEEDGEMALALASGFAHVRPQETWSEALAWLEQAQSIAPPAADGLEEATRLALLGVLVGDSGDTDRALELLDASNAALRHLDQASAEVQWRWGRNRFNETILRYYRGEAGDRNEHFQEWMQEAREHALAAGDRLLAAATLGNLAHHRDPEGDPQEARDLFERAEAEFAAIGITGLGGLTWQRARFEFHARDYERSLEAWRELLDLHDEASVARGDRVGLGLAELVGGEPGAAERIREAIPETLTALEEELVGPNAVSQTLILGRSAVDLDAGDIGRVAILAGASQAESERGVPMPWDLEEHFSEVVDAARHQLGERFDDGFDRGAGLSRAELAAFLREGLSGSGAVAG